MQVKEATKSIDDLISSLKDLKKGLDTTLGSTENNKLDQNTKKAKKNIDTIGAIKKALNFSGIVIGLRKGADLVKNISSEYIDLIETNNLFEVSMGKVVNQYGNLDVEASKYYTKAMEFQDEMNEKLLTNEAELKNYQAMYYSMLKSQGIDKDASYLMSESLTKAGYDIASLYNLSVDDAMNKLKSGLAGQVESLRQIGIDVSESSLETVLNQLGIDRSVQELSYAEKEIARYIAIVQQGGQAQGDFARTMDSSANQIRIFQNQLAELKQVAGAFIMNTFGNILVYVNAITMVIKEILKSFASLFGYDLESGGTNLAESTGIEDLNSGLDSAVGTAKQLKKQLMGFDEINNITPQTNSGGGSGSGGSTGIDDRLLNSLKEWDNQMDSVSGKAQKIRDSILDWLGVTDGTYKNLKRIGIVLGSIVSLLAIGKVVKWFTQLSGIIAGTVTSGSALQFAISGIVKGISSFSGILSAITSPIGLAIIGITALVAGLAYVYATNEDVRNSLQEVGNTFVENLQPIIEFFSNTVIPDLQNAWNSLLEILSPLGEFIEGMFTSCWNDFIIPALKWLAEDVLPMVIDTFKNLWNNVLKPLAEFIGNVLNPVIEIISELLTLLWQNVVVPLAQAIGELLAKAFEGVCDVLNNTVIPVINGVIDVLNWLWQNVLSPIISFLWDTFQPAFEQVFNGIKDIIDGIKQTFGGLIEFISGVFSGDWSKAWEGIKNIFSGIWNTLTSVIKTPINAILALIEGLINKIISGFNWLKQQINKISFQVPDWVPGIGGKSLGFNLKMFSTISLPRFQKGGFPEDGLFFANHNELVGKFNNGKTAVANNEQIIEGIKRGVQEGITEMTKSLKVESNIDYNSIYNQMMSRSQTKDTEKIVDKIAIAITNSLKNADLNVNIEAKTDEGVIVKKIVKANQEHLMQTGEPLLGY